jgi:hypothetical protein
LKAPLDLDCPVHANTGVLPETAAICLRRYVKCGVNVKDDPARSHRKIVAKRLLQVGKCLLQ